MAKEQKYIFERHLGGVNYEASIISFRVFQKMIKLNPHLKIDDFKITPISYEGEKYKEDNINTAQLDLF